MNQQLSIIKEFKTALHGDKAQEGFSAQLPSDVPVDKFTAVVIRAVQEDPDLLDADRTSLFLACQRAAQDGLIPDKREGALVVYKTKRNDQWVKVVQWQAMIGGLRKCLAKNGFDIRAEVVHEGDFFDQDLGDEPTITHKPPPLNTDRGKIIGAYAIATNIDTGKKYREVMNIDQINEVRSVARSDKIWSKWFAEMARKTVARRLIKFLPIANDDDRLASMIERDNDNFKGLDSAGPSSTAQAVQSAARIEQKPQDLPPQTIEVESESPVPQEEPIQQEETTPQGESAPVPMGRDGMEPGF